MLNFENKLLSSRHNAGNVTVTSRKIMHYEKNPIPAHHDCNIRLSCTD